MKKSCARSYKTQLILIGKNQTFDLPLHTLEGYKT